MWQSLRLNEFAELVRCEDSILEVFKKALNLPFVLRRLVSASDHYVRLLVMC